MTPPSGSLPGVPHRTADDLDGSLIVLQVELESARILEATSAAVAFYGWPRATLLTMLLVEVEEQPLAVWRASLGDLDTGGARRVRRTHRVAGGSRREVETFLRVVEAAHRPVLQVVIHEATPLAPPTDRPADRGVAEPLPDAVTRLAGGLAHDYNNLFTVIRGATGFLRDGLDAASPLLADVAAIERASDRADALTRRLLTIGRELLEPVETVELNQLLRDELATLRDELPLRILVQLELSETPVLVATNRATVRDELHRFIDQARRAMPAAGTIRLATRQLVQRPPGSAEGGALQPVGVLSMRLPESAVQEERHFPLVGTPAFPDEAPPTAATSRLTGTVLLVDDDPQLRALARRMLEALGSRVVTAGSGAEALAILTERAPEVAVVLTDLTMPELSGLELIDHIAERFPSLPVVAMSGRSDELDVPVVRGRTRVPFVGKPFTRDTLGRILRDAMASR